MVLQLLQLLAAGRSPGAANEYQYHSPRVEYICEPNFLAIAGLQCKRRCYVSNPEADHFSGPPCSPISIRKGLQESFNLLSHDARRVNAWTLVALVSPLPPVSEYVMIVATTRGLYL